MVVEIIDKLKVHFSDTEIWLSTGRRAKAGGGRGVPVRVGLKPLSV